MSDRLRDAFGELRTSAMRSIEAPGVDAVRRTVRRRRAAKLSAASLGFTGIALASAVALAQTGPVGGATRTTEPPTTITLASSAAPSASQWEVPTPTPSDVTPSDSTPSGGVTAGATTATPCYAPGLLRLTQPNTNNDVTVTWDDSGYPACAGHSATWFWATYTLDASGNAHLFSSQKIMLGPLNRVSHATLDDPGGCGIAWYVVLGDVSIPSTIPAKQVSGVAGGPEPFSRSDGSSQQTQWDVRPNCTTPSPSPYHTLPSPSPS
jgi:hypothetical protein